MRGAPNPPIFKPCPTCGVTFKVHVCTLARGGGKYCSLACRPYRGAGNPKWRGGRTIEKGTGRVIVYAPDHPNATLMGGGHIYEYRLIASLKIGRPLARNEIVHHVNGDPTDNRPENLEVMTQSQHIERHRVEMEAARAAHR